jgi:hypothetical protein
VEHIPEEIQKQVTKLVQIKTGDPRARAHSFGTLPGHAGFSCLILERSDGGAPAGRMIIRIAPPRLPWLPNRRRY